MGYVVALLGVGGVGRTTFTYSVLRASAKPFKTLKPSIYRTFIEGYPVDIIDTPGRWAQEVAENFVRLWRFRVDLAIYMYDLTDVDSLRAISELHSALLDLGARPAASLALLGNKLDLAEEVGVLVDRASTAKALGVAGFAEISALKDGPERLASLLAQWLGLREPRSVEEAAEALILLTASLFKSLDREAEAALEEVAEEAATRLGVRIDWRAVLSPYMKGDINHKALEARLEALLPALYKHRALVDKLLSKFAEG